MSTSRPILVVGGGIAGTTCALEIVATGLDAVLVERLPTIGGRVLHHHRYAPKMCPPSCGLELNFRRLERNPNIRVLTQTEVTGATQTEDGWVVHLQSAPAYVNDRCTMCGACSLVCPSGSIHLVHPNAWPRKYVIDGDPCPEACTRCVTACRYDAIELDIKSTQEELEVSAIILATGWDPYPLDRMLEYGGGQFVDVISNVIMEQMASTYGPTGGKIVRPSTGEPPSRVVFVQCAGSRDRNHLPYCSSVCCLVSLKQAVYVHEMLPTAEIVIYYIDMRSVGRNQDLLDKVTSIPEVSLIRGKVGRIERNAAGRLVAIVEDVHNGRLLNDSADLFVLATGMMPSQAVLVNACQRDVDGFIVDDPERRLFVAGVARRPDDVAASIRSAVSSAAKAIVSVSDQ